MPSCQRFTNSFPSLTFFQDIPECIICFSSEDTSILMNTPCCKKPIHDECQENWWISRAKADAPINCPYCRKDLPEIGQAALKDAFAHKPLRQAANYRDIQERDWDDSLFYLDDPDFMAIVRLKIGRMLFCQDILGNYNVEFEDFETGLTRRICVGFTKR